MDCNPPGSSVRGISQARTLEWVAFPFSRDLPDPGIEPESLTSPALADRFFATSTIRKKVKVKVAQSCTTLCDPMDHTVHGILQARILEWVAFPFSRGSSNPGIEPRSPTLQEYSLPAEAQGKPRNTGVGSLPLLEGIFSIQESNQGLLHCRRILYQPERSGKPREC